MFLAYRAKTSKSLQFEMFVVLFVLVVSEVPKLLNDLGVLNFSAIEDTGLIIHTFSMILLSLFIALRAGKYFRQRGPDR
jgi:hypothetical protein